MGHDAKIKRARNEAGFLRKLFGGRTDAQSLWRRTVLHGATCCHCQTAKAIGTINMFWPVADGVLEYATCLGLLNHKNQLLR